jgi:carboxynorspermidine decarboxylase
MNLSKIKTPAYVLDVAKLKANLEKAAHIKQQTGAKIILALKSWSMFSAFDIVKPYLDGTTASGLYEAKLGQQEFGKEIHVYSPAYDDAEIDELSKFADHIYFNSPSQHAKYAAKMKNAKIGMRINPQLSQVKTDLYNPCAPCSRFGVLDVSSLPENLDALHFHALCESSAEESANFINHISNNYAAQIARVKEVNFGGGHYFTYPGYETEKLINALNNFQQKHGVQAILEPGGAIVYDTGYLVSTVLDIVHNQMDIAILDTSATCHMPDVLEMPYRPNIIGDAPAHQNKYRLTGKTCLTGDVIGDYAFEAPLTIGQKLVFLDMMQYAMVKNTTFNGIPLPDIGMIDENGNYKIIKEFGYDDFKMRQS